jgi:hypothetical protein
MAGIPIGLISMAWILFVSRVYHINMTKKSVPATALFLKKSAG